MSREKPNTYTAEFRESAVKLANESNLSIAQVAKDLGINENTNKLLRQYMPKKTDLSVHSQEQLDRMAAELNDRPRKTLNFSSPSQKISAVLPGQSRLNSADDTK